ncbi:MAG: LptF/LptG family permease [Candidatus Hydrogenedentota bacterium]|nr:MAG: LptF/LptG family permease [Candidatus Hydrogenedentota bacterium]
MTRLSRFLGFRYLASLLLFFLLFSSLFLLVELFELRRYVADAKTALLLGTYLRYRLPFLAVFSAPIATLVAALAVTAWRNHFHEIVAARACGISPFQIAAGPIVFSILLTLLLLAGTEWVVPAQAEKADFIKTVRLKKLAPPEEVFYDIAFTLSDSSYALAQRFSPNTGVLESLTLLTVNASHTRVEKRISIPRLDYHIQERIWISPEGKSYPLPSPEYIALVCTAGNFRPLSEQPVEAVRLSDLFRDYTTIRTLEETLPPSDRLERQKSVRLARISTKLAFPLAVPFLTLLGAALGMKKSRGRTLAHAVSAGLAATLAFILLTDLTFSVAELIASSPLLRFTSGLIPWTAPLLVSLTSLNFSRRC